MKLTLYNSDWWLPEPRPFVWTLCCSREVPGLSLEYLNPFDI